MRATLLRLWRFAARAVTGAAKWAVLVVVMAVAVGSAVALFLWVLDRATQARFDHPWLIWLMPVAGFAMVWVYQRYGAGSEGGTPLILDDIHRPADRVPLRMAPLVLGASVLTHLVGGSAGREGTAVQIGGALAAGVGRVAGLTPADRRRMLVAGIAAGFGAVFGTPVAGTLFALEIARWRQGHRQGLAGALLPAIGGALLGDWTVQAWGVGHVHYLVAAAGGPGLVVAPVLLVQVAVAAVVFGIAARGYVGASGALGALLRRAIPYAPLRPVLAGLVLIALVHLLGTRAYLGLGVWTAIPGDATIPGFFDPGAADYTSWFWKAVFTIITLSAGFKGGEVTPLFFIGAGLGNAAGAVLGAPLDLMAAVGFVALFAAATRTPLASAVMGVELFGAAIAVPLALGCLVAWGVSGKRGVYGSPPPPPGEPRA